MPLLVLIGAVFAARAILSSAPQAERQDAPPGLPTVEAMRLMPTRYAVMLDSRGTVRPSRRTTLAPEVAGSISALSPRFVAGGTFEAGEVLVRLDDRDYRIALTRARANLAQAEAALVEQRAQAQAARADWQALGRRGEPSALTLREPQTAAALASRDAARAETERAQLDLARTRIEAPYAGRVLAREVDEGQFVNRGAPLGVVYAVESVEVRLPIGTRQLAHLQLPSGNAPGAMLQVSLDADEDAHRWQGELLRAEGVDADTQQLNVVARIDAPFADEAHPLRIGRYVQARIQGRTLEPVFVIPRASLREDREVLLLAELAGDGRGGSDGEGHGGQLQRRAVTVVWSDDEVAVVSEGLQAGEVLVLTPLATVSDGTPVKAVIDGEPPASEQTSEQAPEQIPEPEPDRAANADLQG